MLHAYRIGALGHDNNNKLTIIQNLLSDIMPPWMKQWRPMTLHGFASWWVWIEERWYSVVCHHFLHLCHPACQCTLVLGSCKLDRDLSSLLHNDLHWTFNYKLNVTVHRCLQEKAPTVAPSFRSRRPSITMVSHLTALYYATLLAELVQVPRLVGHRSDIVELCIRSSMWSNTKFGQFSRKLLLQVIKLTKRSRDG